MKIGRTFFYIFLLVLLPLSSIADLRGHVVSISNRNEIWMTNLKDLRNKYLLYKHNTPILKLSVQKDSPYIAIVSRNEDGIGPHHTKEDLYLVDISRDHAVLIRDGFDYIADIDISHRGDIVFANNSIQQKDIKKGVYLIRRNEIGKHPSKIILLKEIRGAQQVEWRPDGKQIVYSSSTGVFLLDVNTRGETLLSKIGNYPTFSPDGKKLAFTYTNVVIGNIQIDIISIDTRQPLRTINDFVLPNYSTYKILWSPDGEYLIYRSTVPNLLDQKTIRHNLAVPVNGGPAEKIETGINDWMNPTYPVETLNRLATLWSKIKR